LFGSVVRLRDDIPAEDLGIGLGGRWRIFEMAAKKCAHETCQCLAPEGEKYCSTFCKDSEGLTTLQCDCGHSGCEAKGL
jgi:hypothetical protein